MRTHIITAHEEEYSNNSRTLGVLLNLDKEHNRIDSLIYVYEGSRKMYTFFNTIMDMNEFTLYRNGKFKRAYLSEEDFDKYYDAPYISGLFTEKLSWVSNNSTES